MTPSTRRPRMTVKHKKAAETNAATPMRESWRKRRDASSARASPTMRGTKASRRVTLPSARSRRRATKTCVTRRNVDPKKAVDQMPERVTSDETARLEPTVATAATKLRAVKTKRMSMSHKGRKIHHQDSFQASNSHGDGHPSRTGLISILSTSSAPNPASSARTK